MRAKTIVGPRHAHVAVMPDRTLRYRYHVPGVGRCEFSLLSEVGEPWVPELRALRGTLGRVETVDLDVKPWVADRLVPA